MKKLILFWACGLIYSLAYSQTENSISKELTDSLKQIFKRGYINGFSVAIVSSDSTLYNKAFGYADISEKKKYTASTIQPIASISKTAIGISLLKAQEMGKLKLDDPINQYLPFSVVNPYFPEENITIRQLASHTSTIKDASQYDGRGYVLREKSNAGKKVEKNFRPPNELMDYAVLLEKILSIDGDWYKKKNFIKKKPGVIFEYSNLGAGLAALVLENAVGESFPKFTKTHIFEPLGMSDTGWSLKDVDGSKHTKLYADQNTELAPYQLVNYPDGGMITSSTDLGRYLIELISGYNRNGTLLRAESYTELFSPNLNDENHKDRSESAYNDEYNMGIFMGMSAKGQIGHSGGDPAVTTLMFFNSETKIGKLLIANTVLSKEGIKEFIDIFKMLASYETKL
ncbi:serine hydrolase domain-containing protein [Maribacter halichondriae]|uniref:serine hydrolase domain-containing protein n=1 Tax=Maribacter halichondriae TaxID=2980554 RepID=UPI002358859F|nr:serine hydrolase domain-containing protein [Maribacter sp. Hal144]